MAELILSTGVIWTIIAFVLLILWIALPFAVFGIKDRLDNQTSVMKKILKELEKTNNCNCIQSNATTQDKLEKIQENTHFDHYEAQFGIKRPNKE